MSEITCFCPGIKHVIGHPQQIPVHVLIIELFKAIRVQNNDLIMTSEALNFKGFGRKSKSLYQF